MFLQLKGATGQLTLPYEDSGLDIYMASEDVISPRHSDKYLVEAVSA